VDVFCFFTVSSSARVGNLLLAWRVVPRHTTHYCTFRIAGQAAGFRKVGPASVCQATRRADSVMVGDRDHRANTNVDERFEMAPGRPGWAWQGRAQCSQVTMGSCSKDWRVPPAYSNVKPPGTALNYYYYYSTPALRRRRPF
jgi:hypothetical protein